MEKQVVSPRLGARYGTKFARIINSKTGLEYHGPSWLDLSENDNEISQMRSKMRPILITTCCKTTSGKMKLTLSLPQTTNLLEKTVKLQLI